LSPLVDFRGRHCDWDRHLIRWVDHVGRHSWGRRTLDLLLWVDRSFRAAITIRRH
jgi:hypothetical protein